MKDSHTGLFNHRYLMDMLEIEFARAQRYGYPLSVFMLDIDSFKSINDRYGHLFADRVLKQFSNWLVPTMRRCDVVTRFGGDEFVILLPRANLSQTRSAVDRLLRYTKRHHSRSAAKKVKIRFSGAIVSYPERQVSNGVALIKLADQLLAKAKGYGGGKVYPLLSS
ncbi:MAG: GGDEF domain-containing protein [Candidatus Omnitrophica bacterium]|nr:GGDEF domain-containing protein [Candidatus Omnitrophota bacterium]